MLNEITSFFYDIKNSLLIDVDIRFFLIYLTLFFFSFFIREVFANFFIRRLTILFASSNDVFSSLKRPVKYIPFFIVLIIFNLTIETSNENIELYLNKIIKSFFTIVLFWVFNCLAIPLSNIIFKNSQLLTDELKYWLFKIIRYTIIILGVVAILETWGIKVGPIVAGLGLFGIAVALGAQDLFKNLISGLLIILEKNISIGDVVLIPNQAEGTIENIGFRSTLIRKFDSTPVSIPNFLFSESIIQNYTNRKYRRINWTIGIEYGAQTSQLKDLTAQIKNYIISNDRDFKVDEIYKCYVVLKDFGESSIDILIYCFTNTNDWENYLNIKEELALFISKKVRDIGLSFAFPSKKIYFDNIKSFKIDD